MKAWTLTLAQPTNPQRSFFNGFFGTPPEARLAILRRVPSTSPPRYNLRRQGSIHVLSPYLGQTVRFGASLKVEKGDIVAPHHPNLGAGVRPGSLSQQRLASESPAGRVHEHNRGAPGPAAATTGQAGNLRLPLQHSPPALHRHRG